MGKPLTYDGYCTVKPEFGCDETGSKYFGWCGRSAPLGGAPLTYLVYRCLQMSTDVYRCLQNILYITVLAISR
eukprot:scaffold223531_cov47-Attheya_sp.AAC.1